MARVIKPGDVTPPADIVLTDQPGQVVDTAGDPLTFKGKEIVFDAIDDVSSPAPIVIPSGGQVASGSPIVHLTFEQLERLIERATQASRGSSGEGSQELKLAAAALQTLGDEVKRTVRRSNATHPKISAFSYPEGDDARPKPVLRYETYFCGVRQREDQLTPTEIDLFNKFERTMEAGGGKYTAIVEKNGSSTRLIIRAPAKTIDDLASIPPLTQLLSELLFGSEVADPTKSMERLLAAEARIAELLARVEALSKGDRTGAPA